MVASERPRAGAPLVADEDLGAGDTSFDRGRAALNPRLFDSTRARRAIPTLEHRLRRIRQPRGRRWGRHGGGSGGRGDVCGVALALWDENIEAAAAPGLETACAVY